MSAIKRWLSKLWDMINPYAGGLNAHPLLWIEAKQAPEWARSPDHLWRKSLKILGVATIIGGGISLLFYLTSIYIAEISVVFVLLIFLPGIIIDSRALAASIDSINTDFITGRWDALRITSLSEQGIIYAKHASTQLRVWQTTTLITGLRLGFILALIGLMVMRTVDTVLIDPSVIQIGFLPIGFCLIFLILLLVLEPYWRLRAVTALGMAVSAMVKNLPLANLVAWILLISFWLLQVAVLGTTLLMLSLPIFLVGARVSTSYSLNLFTLMLLLIVVVICLLATMALVQGLYNIVQDWGLRRVLSRLKK